MKVAIVSDTHGHLDGRVEAVVRGCDAVVHAGDVGAAQVLAALRPRRGVVRAVRGNNDTADRWPAQDAGRLDELPDEARLELPGGMLVVVHGHRAGRAATRHRWLRRTYPDARMVAYGHSHRLCCDRTALPWVVNPGAAGRARTYGGPSCLILSAGGAAWTLEVRRFDPPARRARRA